MTFTLNSLRRIADVEQTPVTSFATGAVIDVLAPMEATATAVPSAQPHKEPERLFPARPAEIVRASVPALAPPVTPVAAECATSTLAERLSDVGSGVAGQSEAGHSEVASNAPVPEPAQGMIDAFRDRFASALAEAHTQTNESAAGDVDERGTVAAEHDGAGMEFGAEPDPIDATNLSAGTGMDRDDDPVAGWVPEPQPQPPRANRRRSRRRDRTRASSPQWRSGLARQAKRLAATVVLAGAGVLAADGITGERVDWLRQRSFALAGTIGRQVASVIEQTSPSATAKIPADGKMDRGPLLASLGTPPAADAAGVPPVAPAAAKPAFVADVSPGSGIVPPLRRVKPDAGFSAAWRPAADSVPAAPPVVAAAKPVEAAKVAALDATPRLVQLPEPVPRGARVSVAVQPPPAIPAAAAKTAAKDDGELGVAAQRAVAQHAAGIVPTAPKLVRESQVRVALAEMPATKLSDAPNASHILPQARTAAQPAQASELARRTAAIPGNSPAANPTSGPTSGITTRGGAPAAAKNGQSLPWIAQDTGRPRDDLYTRIGEALIGTSMRSALGAGGMVVDPASGVQTRPVRVLGFEAHTTPNRQDWRAKIYEQQK